MNFILRSLVVLTLIFSASHRAYAVDVKEELAKAFVHFKSGKYLLTIKELDRIANLSKFKKNQKLQGAIAYWKGISYNKIQRYGSAIKSFQKASKLKNRSEDLYYEYGQALYAADKLKRAMKAFAKSVNLRFKPAQSLYYLGFIAQSMKKYALALKFYYKLENLTFDQDDEVLQAGLFQMAEIFYIQNKAKSKAADRMKRKVIPAFRKALNVDRTSVIAKDISRRIRDIEKKYEIPAGERMANGRVIPNKKMTLRIKGSVEHNSNVTTEADLANVIASTKDSAVYRMSAIWKHRYDFFKRIVTAPEMRLTYTWHQERNIGAIYENDAYLIAPALRNRFEYTAFGKMAAYLLDAQFSYNARDIGASKHIQFNNRTWTMMFGHEINYFRFGSTTLQYKYQDFQSVTTTADSYTNTILFSQKFKLPAKFTGILNVTTDLLTVPKTPTDETNTYTFRVDLIRSKLFGGLSFHPAYSIAIVDTKDQKATRGTEKKHNPSMIIYKRWNNFKIAGRWSYIKYVSEDEVNRAYSQTIWGLDFQYNY